MKISVILGHPNDSSFNHAIAKVIIEVLKNNNHDVYFHDLYKENFNPIVEKNEFDNDFSVDKLMKIHCEEISQVDGIVIIHPNWWGQPPAILKGWVDRVIRPDIAYDFTENSNGECLPISLLNARTAIVFNTSNTSQVREVELFGDPLELIWKNCVFKFCGINNFIRRNFSIIDSSSLQQRLGWLKEIEFIIDNEFSKE